jgi:hypothetical protein
MPSLKLLQTALHLLCAIRDNEIDGTERACMLATGNALCDIEGFEEIGEVLVHYAHVAEVAADTDIDVLIDFLEIEIADCAPGNSETRQQQMEFGLN